MTLDEKAMLGLAVLLQLVILVLFYTAGHSDGANAVMLKISKRRIKPHNDSNCRCAACLAWRRRSYGYP